MRLSSQDGFSRSTWRVGRGVAFSCCQRPSVLQNRRSFASAGALFPQKCRQDREAGASRLAQLGRFWEGDVARVVEIRTLSSESFFIALRDEIFFSSLRPAQAGE